MPRAGHCEDESSSGRTCSSGWVPLSRGRESPSEEFSHMSRAPPLRGLAFDLKEGIAGRARLLHRRLRGGREDGDRHASCVIGSALWP